MAKKTILTFLSQGAAGGAGASFLWLIFLILYQPGFYNFLYLSILPVMLLIGLVYGAINGSAIWLVGRLSQRALGWWIRCFVSIASTSIVGLVVNLCWKFFVGQESIVEQHLYLPELVFGFVFSVIIGLLAGSEIDAGRILVFGAGQTTLRPTPENWFSFFSHLLMRIGSLFCLLESLLFVAYLLSVAFSPWGSFTNDETRNAFIGTLLAILYFTGSVYVSFTSPRKPILIAVGLLLNVPLVIWLLRPADPVNLDSNFLELLSLVFISFWLLAIVGRLITPNQAQGMALDENPGSDER